MVLLVAPTFDHRFFEILSEKRRTDRPVVLFLYHREFPMKGKVLLEIMLAICHSQSWADSLSTRGLVWLAKFNLL